MGGGFAEAGRGQIFRDRCLFSPRPFILNAFVSRAVFSFLRVYFIIALAMVPWPGQAVNGRRLRRRRATIDTPACPRYAVPAQE